MFDRIEPVFTTPPDGRSLSDATTFADAAAIVPAPRTPAGGAEVNPQPQTPGLDPERALLPPPGYVAPPPLGAGYPATSGYPAAPGYPATSGYPAAPGHPGGPVPPQGYPGQPMPSPAYPGAPIAGMPVPGAPAVGYASGPQGYPPPPPGYPQPGYPYAGYPGMPPVVPPPGARKKHTRRNIVIAVISAAVLLGMPGVAVALTAAPAASKPITLPQLPEPVDLTKVGDATRDRATVMSRLMAKVTADGEKAMADRDEAAFVKPAANSQVASALRLRYRNLSAMKVAEFTMSASFPMTAGGGRWKSTLTIAYCFGKSGCSRDTVKEPAVWQDTDGGPRLVSLGIQPVGSEWFEQPQPWEQTPLVAAVGKRVVVAVPASLKSRLSFVLQEADKAAVIADSYAVGTKPDFYRVYVANKTEWRTWYGNQPSKWVAGYTTATGTDHADVVINTAEAPNSYLPTMLRHEMTHAASTYGKHYSRDMWWEIEGFAQLAEPPQPAGLKSFVRSYIRRTWNGKLPLDSPSANASANTVAGEYGVAFAAMSYLQKKYGKQAVIDFFNKTVRSGLPMESASQDVFHASWASVQSGIIKGIRAY